MSSSSGPARVARVFGLLAVLVIPVAIVASRYTHGVTLLQSLYVAVPVAFVLALVAVAANRRARIWPCRFLA